MMVPGHQGRRHIIIGLEAKNCNQGLLRYG